MEVHYAIENKYATEELDPDDLQEIFDDLERGVILFLNRDYTLNSTVYLRQRQITILGRGTVIKKGSSLSSSAPLIEINNDIPDNTSQKQIVNDVVIDGIRFINDVESIGSGLSQASTILLKQIGVVLRIAVYALAWLFTFNER
ncbi:MAG: hypothetical protein L0Y80_12580 [Ignavibacteriae bacterium]|nr:hypothetical protein [Ignavibacteriota bacterium]